MHCKCGFDNVASAKFCGRCGVPIPDGTAVSNEMSAVTLGSVATGPKVSGRNRPRASLGVLGVLVVIAATAYWWQNRLPGEYQQDNGGLYPINVNGKVGFMDRGGKTIITPQFDETYGFSEGKAAVRIGNKFGYVNSEGVVSITPQFDDVRNFRYGRAAVKLCCGLWSNSSASDRFGIIDEAGKYVSGPTFLFVGWFFSGNYLPVKTAGGELGYVDRSGKVVISGAFQDLGDFSDGLAPASKGGKWGYIDTTGRWVIDPQFEDGRSFADGVAAVRVGGKVGYIDRQGLFVINPQYESGTSFQNGYASFTTGQKWGVIDISGRIVKEEWSTSPLFFSEGLARVAADDGWGFADVAGNMVISAQFDSADVFRNGLARVDVLGKEAYVTATGAFVVNPFPGTTIAEERARRDAEALQTEIDAATAAGAPYLKEFLGRWTDGFYLVELSYVGGRIRVRERWGDAAEGTVYFGHYSDGTITAQGDPRNFYKFHSPEFRIIETGELLHDCGSCLPDRLKRTSRQIPKIPFKPPVNRD